MEKAIETFHINTQLSVSRRKTYRYLILGVLLLFAAFRPIGFDKDGEAYVKAAEKMIFDPRWLEPTFTLISYLSRLFFSTSVGIFFLYAFTSLVIKFKAINKLSIKSNISIFLYVCMFYFLHELTQIRVSVAIAIFLYSIPYITINKNKFVRNILIATLFHYSALIYLVVLILDSKKMNKLFWLFLPLASYLISDLLYWVINMSLLPFLPSKVLSYLGEENQSNEINLYRVLLLSIYIVSVFSINNLKNKHSVMLLKLFGLSISFYYLLLPLGTGFAVRISGLFSVTIIFIIPLIMDIVKPRKFGEISIISIGAFSLFYLLYIQKVVDFTVLI